MMMMIQEVSWCGFRISCSYRINRFLSSFFFLFWFMFPTSSSRARIYICPPAPYIEREKKRFVPSGHIVYVVDDDDEINQRKDRKSVV